MQYIIRKATEQDLTKAREIYGIARNFMRDNGNLTQWGKGDEPENLTEDDIRQCRGDSCSICIHDRRRPDISED